MLTTTIPNERIPCKRPSPHKVEICAELGSNHSRDCNKACEMIQAAKWAGADSVKVSLFLPEQMCPNSTDPEFQITDGLWKNQTLFALYEKAAMPLDWTPSLKKLAESLGLAFIAGVYHPDILPLVDSYDIERVKVASFEVGWRFFLKKIAESTRYAIVSTGTSPMAEISDAVEVLGKDHMTLLKCTSVYPAPLAAMNLRTIEDMARRFGTRVGLSDHSLGIIAPICSVAMGGTFIEKHIRLSSDTDGLDITFSLDPKQFREMVDAVRDAEKCMGTVDYTPSATQFKRKEVNGEWIRTVK